MRQSEVVSQAEYDALTKHRRQAIHNRVATKTSIAEDLLTILDHQPIGNTVDRFLDALAALIETTSAGQAKTLEAVRGKPQHAPTPSFRSAWADRVEGHVDNRLWEITQELTAFLNRPVDPKTQSLCDICGNKRLGDSSYCHNCGTRILEGARRCRVGECPNEGRRRADCPTNIIH